MMTGGTHQAIGVVNCTLHHGIDSSKRSTGSLDSCFIRPFGDVGVGSEKASFTTALSFFLGNPLCCLFYLLDVDTVVYGSQLILTGSAWRQLYQSFALQPTQGFQHFHGHFQALWLLRVVLWRDMF